jgi:hypothetical protein
MKKLGILIFVLFLLVAICISANAVTIVRVEGVVTTVNENGDYSFDDSIQVGTTFTETYYFSDLTDSSSDPAIGDYAADYSIVSIGDYIFTSSETGMSIGCYANGGYSGNTVVESDGIVYVDSLPYEYNSINWLLHKSSFRLKSTSFIPDSDEFPSSFPDLATFDYYKRWSLISSVDIPYGYTYEGIYLYGEITSIEVIPEPCSLVLLGLGSIALLRKRRLE